MEIIDGEEYLGCIEPGLVRAEPLEPEDVEEEVTAGEVFHHEEQLVQGLEGGVEADHEVAPPATLQHPPLRHHHVQVVPPDDLLLVHHLDGKHCLGPDLLGEVHPPEGSLAKQSQKTEVV